MVPSMANGISQVILRTLRSRDYPGLPRRAQGIPKVLTRERQEVREEMTAEAGVTQCLPGPQAQGMQQPLENEKGKEMDFPLELLEGKCLVTL